MSWGLEKEEGKTLMPETPLVQLRDVHLTLSSGAGPVFILRGIDFSMQPGEAVAIVGPSGSGKSSLMAVTSGMDNASRGQILIDGQDMGAMDEDARARFRRDRMGIVFQAFHLLPTFTALENVAVAAELAGRTDAAHAARSALDSMGLAHRLDHYPAQLSGGEQQRVALARALVNRPRLILADEPTGNLDGDTGRAIADLLFDLPRRMGSGLLLITHDRALAARADRIVSIADGRIVEDAAQARPRAAQA